MQLSKTARNSVNFAQWCINNELNPRQVAELKTLVDRHSNAWVQQNNSGVPSDDKHKQRLEKLEKQIETKAAEMGCTTIEWSGLVPTFTLPNGKDDLLPGF